MDRCGASQVLDNPPHPQPKPPSLQRIMGTLRKLQHQMAWAAEWVSTSDGMALEDQAHPQPTRQAWLRHLVLANSNSSRDRLPQAEEVYLATFSTENKNGRLLVMLTPLFWFRSPNENSSPGESRSSPFNPEAGVFTPPFRRGGRRKRGRGGRGNFPMQPPQT